MARPVTPRFCSRCGGSLRKPEAAAGEETPPWVCSSCGSRVWEDPKVAVAVVVQAPEGGVLLLRRAQHDPAHGLWILPGGFVDRGEELQAAARREVREELGLSVELDGLVGVYSYAGEPVVTVIYAGRSPGRDRGLEPLRPGREALEVRYFGRDEVPWDGLGFRSTQDGLRDFFSPEPGRRALCKERRPA